MNKSKFINLNEEKDLLRIATAGSIDDGKSTLLGRLLYDSKFLYADHVDALKKDSRKKGSVENGTDFALLFDGLKAEREQNITIDVAYRYFSTPKRKFILADSPGHEQYTRNMATGASTADLSIILIDAQKGMLTQSKRHCFIMSLFGIRHLVVAINKMDTVGYSEEIFEKRKRDFSEFAAKLDIHDIHFIPVSALKGDNVVHPSKRMTWFQGGSLLYHLEQVHIASDRNFVDLRFPVQYVLRPNRHFRGYCGTVATGIIRKGDEILVLPSGRKSRVKSLINYDGELEEAFNPMAITVTLEDEIDISRGDMLVHIHNLPLKSNRIEAMIVWMNENPLVTGKPYLFKQTVTMVKGEFTELRYKVNVNTLRREPSECLELNEIGRSVITLSKPLMYDFYSRNRATGKFIVIDPLTNMTVGAGIIINRQPNELIVSKKAAYRSKSPFVHSHKSHVKIEDRLKRLKQQPASIWLTGLPKSGKTTIAYLLEKRLFDMGYTVNVLDGENMRLGISKNLEFTGDDRSENIRRAAEVAKLCNDIGLITIAAFVSPYAEDRLNARKIIGDERFVEVYLSAPLSVCESRDKSGLYKSGRKGDIKNVSGISAPYEPPRAPELNLPTHTLSIEESVESVLNLLRERGIIH